MDTLARAGKKDAAWADGLGLIGRSPRFVDSLVRLRQLAACHAPVLIVGETGTGKELVARAHHYLSERSDRPFVPVNCGAIPDSLCESELFGHRRGAFTHAVDERRGLVAAAGEGTLFFDEVDSLSERGQVALLRFLQDRHYRAVGDDRERESGANVLAASNRPLRELIAAGSFRLDLYFRLCIGDVRLPPLRERVGDAPLLARHFLRGLAARYDRPLVGLDANR